jgi:hypothetical protein
MVAMYKGVTMLEAGLWLLGMTMLGLWPCRESRPGTTATAVLPSRQKCSIGLVPLFASWTVTVLCD